MCSLTPFPIGKDQTPGNPYFFMYMDSYSATPPVIDSNTYRLAVGGATGAYSSDDDDDLDGELSFSQE